MPGTPLNGNGVCAVHKLKIGETVNEHQVEIQEGREQSTATTREITQTDKLNKRLLESVLERMSKTGEFDKFVENQEQEEEEYNELDECNFSNN